MSFGYGVGDVIAVSSLARTIWGRFRDASDQFNAIQTDVFGLHRVLDDIANTLSGLQVTDQQEKDLSVLMKGCRSVLDDTEIFIRKNEGLATASSGLGSKTQKAWRKLKWDSATVNELRDRMVSSTTFLNAFNTSLASQVSLVIKEKVDAIADDTQHLRLSQGQEERETVLQWLSPLNFAPQQSELSGRRQEGTGEWLLKSREFQEWVSLEGKSLVCQGMPGAGKTMLASLVIDHLQQISDKEKVATAYLYCDYKRQDEQTPLNLIASVTKQLLQHQDSIPGRTLEIHQKYHEKRTRPNFQEVLEMAGSSMSCFSRCYLIVDALDELGNSGQVRQTLIGRLRQLQGFHHFNMMTTSRYIPSLALDFHQPLCMNVQASPEDIRRYVEGHISDLPSCVRKDPRLQQTIASTIVDAVEGMFLLAQLHMDSLRDKASSKLIKKALGVLPKGSNALDLAYQGAMQRIEDQMEGFRVLAKQLLGWLTYSERLMTMKEVQHALAIEPGTSSFDEDNLGDVNEIICFCAGLVTVDEETQIIRLVHYTTQEYFKHNGDRILASAQQNIAISCLTYLLYETFEDGWVYESEMENLPHWSIFSNLYFREARAQKNPLLEYAARYWATHVSVCEQRNVKELMMVLIQDNRKVSSASQVMLLVDGKDVLLDDIARTDSRSPLSAMHVIAYLGYETLISELLDHGFEADGQDSTHRTPLCWAAMQGHQAVVSLLLSQSHVNVNNYGHFDNGFKHVPSTTPQNKAALYGRYKVVKPLIRREDMNVNLPDEYGRSPLSYAADLGNSTVAELLLTRRDIEVNSKNQYGDTSFSLAAIGGRRSTVKEPLKHNNIRVNSVNQRWQSPLAMAASRGHKNVVEALLGHPKIDVNTTDQQGKTPLMRAVRMGHKAVVELLLSHIDVELNVKSVSGKTALYKAVQYGHVSIVELLLGCVDIDVNCKDKYGFTSLHEAAKTGDEAIVAMLLGHIGIEVNPEDQQGKPPLAYAIFRNRAAATKLLCAHPDVDLDPRDNYGQYLFALSKAARFSSYQPPYRRDKKQREECLEILRTAIEARSRNKPPNSEPTPP